MGFINDTPPNSKRLTLLQEFDVKRNNSDFREVPIYFLRSKTKVSSDEFVRKVAPRNSERFEADSSPREEAAGFSKLEDFYGANNPFKCGKAEKSWPPPTL